MKLGKIVDVKAITKDNYTDVINIILQRVRITSDENEIDDLKKVKNKRGLKIYKQAIKGRKSLKRQKNKIKI